MPQRRSGIKDIRKNHSRRMHNLDIKTDLRKTIKAFLVLIREKNVKDAETKLKTVYKKIDKAYKRNMFHKNTAARRKSRLARLLLQGQKSAAS